jgi:NitT/TauT family transport system substrate-binding protein
MMKHRALALIVLVVVVAGVAWAISHWSTQDRESEPGTLTEITVAQTGDFPLYAGLYIAEDAGLFAKNGLDVDIISTGGDEKSATAVLTGEAQFGIGDPTFAAIANARGQSLRFVASVVNGAPFWGITFKEDVARRYAATGLQGLRVATFPAPSTAYALQRDMFASQNLTPNIREGAFGSLQGLLEANQADIALELEPNVSVAQARGGRVLYSMAERVTPFTVTGVVVTEAYVTEHPREVQAFCRSLDEAFAMMRSQPAETNALLAKRFPDLPRAALDAAMARSLTAGVIPERAAVNAQGWRRALALRASVGDLADPEAGAAALDQGACGGGSALP